MAFEIPEGARQLLDLIGSVEAPRGYDTLYGNNQNNWPQRLTEMEIDSVVRAGPIWSKRFGSSAAGRYQFINKTLKALRISEAISSGELFNETLQDRLGYVLLDQRGYELFATGRMSRVNFGLGLAREWASFPVLAETMGAHRRVNRGETYYAGDKINKALIRPERVEALLDSLPTGAVEAVWAAYAENAESE